MASNDGGPAFPFVYGDLSKTPTAEPGMSLRQWFAGMAMQGFVAGLATDTDLKVEQLPALSRASYLIADAMLAERSK